MSSSGDNTGKSGQLDQRTDGQPAWAERDTAYTAFMPHYHASPHRGQSAWRWPFLESDRLIVRQPTVGDMASLHHALNTPGVREYFERYRVGEFHVTEQYFYSFLIGQYQQQTGLYPVIIDRSEEHHVLGVVGLTKFDWENSCCEIGVWVRSDYWGKGIAGEACSLVMSFGFGALNMERIQMLIEAGNTRSVKVFEKLGAVSEGVLRNRIRRKSGHKDMRCMSILSDEFGPRAY